MENRTKIRKRCTDKGTYKSLNLSGRLMWGHYIREIQKKIDKGHFVKIIFYEMTFIL